MLEPRVKKVDVLPPLLQTECPSQYLSHLSLPPICHGPYTTGSCSEVSFLQLMCTHNPISFQNTPLLLSGISYPSYHGLCPPFPPRKLRLFTLIRFRVSSSDPLHYHLFITSNLSNPNPFPSPPSLPIFPLTSVQTSWNLDQTPFLFPVSIKNPRLQLISYPV